MYFSQLDLVVVVVVVVVSHYYTSDEGAMLVHLITLHGHSPPRASNLRSLELSWNLFQQCKCPSMP